MNQSLNDNQIRQLRHLNRIMISLYIVTIILVSAIISVLIMDKSDEAIKQKISSMTTTLNAQLQLSLNRCISDLEDNATMIFANNNAINYDATVTHSDEYEALTIEQEIAESLRSLSITRNYVDFCIIYRNKRNIGLLSNGTRTLFNNNMFDEFSAQMTAKSTQGYWFTGCHDDYTRIYYVKQIHSNALLLTSFYAAELSQILAPAQNDYLITTRITDSDHVILYSPESEEFGTVVSAELSQRIDSFTSATVMDDDYLISVSNSANNWYLICSTDANVILSDLHNAQVTVTITCCVAVLAGILVSLAFSRHLTRSMAVQITELNTLAQNDQLTGILNKLSFEHAVSHRLHEVSADDRYALIIFDIDDFKSLNDLYGHSFGDKVLKHLGCILQQTFSSEDLLGRIGGDEFCILLTIPSSEHKQAAAFVNHLCDTLCEAVRSCSFSEQPEAALSISVGVSLYGIHGTDFNTLYQNADQALYTSKGRGKNTVHIKEY